MQNLGAVFEQADSGIGYRRETGVITGIGAAPEKSDGKIFLRSYQGIYDHARLDFADSEIVIHVTGTETRGGRK